LTLKVVQKDSEFSPGSWRYKPPASFVSRRVNIVIRAVLGNLFPRELTNEFPGFKIALWAFYVFTALTLWRSQHHLFAYDGGAQSIATIPLETYSNGAATTIIGVFALWGLSQLVIGLIYLVAAIRYRSMIPMLYLLGLVEYLVRLFYIPAYKPIETAGTAPGAAGNLPLVIFSLVMLIASCWPHESGSAEGHGPRAR
jgi:hypothetical protein